MTARRISAIVVFLLFREGLGTVGPAYGQTEKYEALLADSRIASSLIWFQDGSAAGLDYQHWPTERRSQLSEIIAGLESGAAYPLDAPPPLISDRYISRDDAFLLYALRVAQSLWVETNGLVGWSILDLSETELALLFDGTSMYDCGSVNICLTRLPSFGRVTDWNPQFSYTFLQSNGLIRETQKETVYAFSYWTRRNLIHILGVDDNPDGHERLYGYRGDPPVDRVLEPLPDQRHVTAGCWGTSGLFNAVLRSVNIPVESRTTYLGPPANGGRQWHSKFNLPTVDLGVLHGDDLYDAWLRPWGSNNVHTAFVFESLRWLEDFGDDPKVLDCNETWCNSPAAQASFNHGRLTRELAAAYFSTYLMQFRLSGGTEDTIPQSFRDNLAGVAVGGGIYTYAHPFFSDDEIDAIAERLDDEIRRLGNGSWSDGAYKFRHSPGSEAAIEPALEGYVPFASLAPSQSTAAALDLLAFENYSVGEIETYHWDFGDGSESDEFEAEHTFTFVDSFTVALTVAGPGGMATAATIVPVSGVPGVDEPSAVSLTSPADGAEGVGAPVRFEWANLVEARRYHLQVSLDAAFGQVEYEVKATSEASPVIDSLQAETQYFWRVRAKNEGGVGPWSEVRTFATLIASPDAVTLVLPADQATEVAAYTGFSWQPLDGAAAYHLQVGDDAGLSSLIVDDSTLTEAVFTVSEPLAYSTAYYWHVRAALDDGLGKTTGLLFGPWSETRSFTVAVGTATEGDPGIPTAFALHPAYPNPFNPSTTIRYDVPEAVEVSLVVFDALGRSVDDLGTRHLAPGTYSVEWDASWRPSGMYFVRMEAGAFTQTRRLLLLK